MFSKLHFVIALFFALLVSTASSFSIVVSPTIAPTRASYSAIHPLWAAGPAVLEPPVKEVEKVKDIVEDKEANYKKGGWAVRLFNDPMNKREFVAMCLTKIVGLSDGQAYQVMMQAHQQGLSIVGRFDFERAELYRNALAENGLTCDMIPVEED